MKCCSYICFNIFQLNPALCSMSLLILSYIISFVFIIIYILFYKFQCLVYNIIDDFNGFLSLFYKFPRVLKHVACCFLEFLVICLLNSMRYVQVSSFFWLKLNLFLAHRFYYRTFLNLITWVRPNKNEMLYIKHCLSIIYTNKIYFRFFIICETLLISS